MVSRSGNILDTLQDGLTKVISADSGLTLAALDRGFAPWGSGAPKQI